jgi:cytochrome b561
MERFGIVTRICHWVIAVLIILQYSVVYSEMGLAKEDPLKLQMILLHKSFGVIVLVLALTMLIARYKEGRPPYLIHPSLDPKLQYYQNLLAKTVHVLLYLSLILMPLMGVLMSIYGGRGVAIFGFPLFAPNFITPNKPLAEIFYHGHVWTSYLIIGLAVLHVTGAFYHQWILKDKVMDRML